MADLNAIKDLVVCSFKGTTPDPTEFSTKDVKESLSKEIHALASDYRTYQRNKMDLFEIMEEAYDEIIPDYIEAYMGSFAEIKTTADGQKVVYRVKRGRQRAKQFITKVGLSGAYESFRLDADTFELGGHAIGGAAYIDYERYANDLRYDGYEEYSEGIIENR